MHERCKGAWEWGRCLLVGPTRSPFTLVCTLFLCQLLLSANFLAPPQASQLQTPELNLTLCLNPTNICPVLFHMYCFFSATLAQAWATFANASRTLQSTGQ